jgi:hypothetical protein
MDATFFSGRTATGDVQIAQPDVRRDDSGELRRPSNEVSDALGADHLR